MSIKNFCCFFCCLFIATLAANTVIPLEWNPRFDTSVAREILINRDKLEKKAAIPSSKKLKVTAVTPQGEKELDVTVLDSNTPNCEILHFNVPEGTSSLYASVSEDKNTKIRSSLINDNLFKSALNDIRNWKPSKYVKIRSSKKGIVFKVISHGTHTVRYFVNLPDGYAGKPAKFDFAVKSLSKLTWGNGVKIEQYDRNGKLLPESLTDPRWISLMRPPQVETLHCETGYFHKDAVKIAFCFEIVAKKHAFDNYGIPIKNHMISLPEAEISRLSVRKAASLPFPAYDRSFFTPGVSSEQGDTGLVLNGRSVFFFTPNSHAVYAENKQIRGEEDTFWPLNDATVEFFMKPLWSKSEKRELTLINATNRDREDRKSYKKPFGTMFSATYNPAGSHWQIIVKDARLSDKVFKFKHSVELNKWTHVAFQYGKDGFSVFINGKKVFEDNKYSFKSRDISKEKKRNGLVVQQVEFGGNKGMSRANYDRSAQAPLVPFALDLLRISSGRRYVQEFTPAKSFSLDNKTAALFEFDSSIDGKSARGQGNISGSINNKYLPLSSRLLTVNGKKIQYYPAKLMAHSNPDIVLNKLNYPDLPAVKDFKAARKDNIIKYTAQRGKIKEITVPENTYMDYVEISCPSGATTLKHPALIANDELDTRSYGDIADSLQLDKKSAKERANTIFNLVLKASDYLMTNQVTFAPDSDLMLRTFDNALLMLNNYCGFECGPLNTMTAYLFTCSGQLPATMVAGYGHAFEQVFYDGKTHVYDLSAQRFFPAHDNETAASLEELDRENGPFQHYNSSGGAFIRQGVSRSYQRNVPVMSGRVAYNLNPGEKIRFYFYNDGTYNDIQTKRCIDPNAVHPNDKFPYPPEMSIIKPAPAEVAIKEKVFQIPRPFPHYSNAHLSFSGKPGKGNSAFTKITANDFCYRVSVPYPIVAGTYKALLADGKVADIEISTDGAKTFRKLVTDENGRATYAVRARAAYYIKVKAPVEKVVKFDAVTEMMVNSRIQNCRLNGGRNTILFKSESGETADITIACRSDAKEIEIQKAPYSGTIKGNERQISVVEPGKTAVHPIKGVSSAAAINSSSGAIARIENGKLFITAKSEGANPRFEFVTITDGDAKKELTVLVAKGARISFADDAKIIKDMKLVKADSQLIQDCVVAKKRNAEVKFSFSEIPAGNYLVWVLSRIPTSMIRTPILGMKLPGGKYIGVMRGIHAGNDFYKAEYGKGKSRFRWDAALDNDQNKYPYHSPRMTMLGKCDSLSFKMLQNIETEIAAVIILPAVDNEFRSEMVKILCGINCEPWKLKNFRNK